MPEHTCEIKVERMLSHEGKSLLERCISMTANKRISVKAATIAFTLLLVVGFALLVTVAYTSYDNLIKKMERVIDGQKQYASSSDGFVGISLVGDGMRFTSKKGQPIRNWELNHMNGSIGLIGGDRIQITTPGFYFIYAQMFFFRNGEHFSKQNETRDAMDFGIVDLNIPRRVIGASVPFDGCRDACTHHMSEVVYYKGGELLSLETYTDGVQFKMIKDKSFFGTYLISASRAS